MADFCPRWPVHERAALAGHLKKEGRDLGPSDPRTSVGMLGLNYPRDLGGWVRGKRDGTVTLDLFLPVPFGEGLGDSRRGHFSSIGGFGGTQKRCGQN